MERLIRLGFIKVGKWVLENGLLNYKLNKHSEEKKLLYSFVSGKKIYY